jgi:hypothetical protein
MKRTTKISSSDESNAERKRLALELKMKMVSDEHCVSVGKMLIDDESFERSKSWIKEMDAGQQSELLVWLALVLLENLSYYEGKPDVESKVYEIFSMTDISSHGAVFSMMQFNIDSYISVYSKFIRLLVFRNRFLKNRELIIRR